jgi:hypothetical protein
MATALDLLMSAKEDVNLLSEESDICTIDAKTRTIFVPSTIVVGGVQSDKNAERIKFSCPKIVGDNLDLSKFSVRINFENVSSVDFNVSIKDQYICDDVAVDGENVTFSWLIGRNAARYMGTVRFIVCAVKTDSDSNISVEWNTAIAEVPVLEGIEIDQPQIGQEEKDVINQLLELTKNTSAEAVQNVNSAKEQAIKDIQSVSQPDTTLTIEGGLAEAKATGEAIGSLKEDIVYRTSSVIAQLNMTDGALLKKDGGKENNESWATSNMIDVNGCKYIRVKGLFNNLSEQSYYTHIVFYTYDEFSLDSKVSSVTLAEAEIETVDVTLEIPSEANYFAICNSVANKGSVSVEKYYESLVLSDLSNLIDITSVMVEKDFEANGLSLSFANNVVTFNGTPTENSTFLLYSSNEYSLLKNDGEYVIDFKPMNGIENVYLQIFNNGTDNALINAQKVDNQLITIPSNAENIFIRFIAFPRTYNNEKYYFSIKRKVDCYSDVHIDSSNELYEFMKSPTPFTRVYLNPKEYHLYSGLFEKDIANDIKFSIDSFLHDVIIYGNNAKITLNIPSEVLNEKPEVCNTYSCLNVKGNVEINDLECIGKNCRYVLHEESLDSFLWFNTKHIYNNCKFSYTGYDYPTVNANTIGCGFSKGQIVEFVNCEFENETPSDYTFYVHGRDFNISRLAFINCIFNNRENAFSIGLSQYTGNGKKSSVLIDNSYIGKVKLFTQPNGVRTNQWAITSINSYISQILTDDSTELLYAPKNINTISGTIN